MPCTCEMRWKYCAQLFRQEVQTRYSLLSVLGESRFKCEGQRKDCSGFHKLYIYWCDSQIQSPVLWSQMTLLVFSLLWIDTKHERNELMEKVYPELKTFCHDRGYEFQVGRTSIDIYALPQILVLTYFYSSGCWHAMGNSWGGRRQPHDDRDVLERNRSLSKTLNWSQLCGN